jgi:protein TonB
MLTRLIESRATVARNEFGASASVAIHLVIITVAAYFTTAKAIVEEEPDQPPPLVWLHTQPIAHHNAQSTRTRSQTPSSRATAAPATVSLAISPNIPSVDITLASVRPAEFGDGVTGSTTNASASSGPTHNDGEAFDALEVDTPASALAGGIAPTYPPSLRSAGIEGRVIAQFVVDTRGRASRESIRILSATNDLFSESVRKAIGQMRFAPAKIGSKPVAQLVQQLFVFKLDR